MTVEMALVDFIPVVLFLVTIILLQRDLYEGFSKGAFALFAGGGIMVFCAGFFKATWKLLYALNICDFQKLNQVFFPMQATGFHALGGAGRQCSRTGVASYRNYDAASGRTGRLSIEKKIIRKEINLILVYLFFSAMALWYNQSSRTDTLKLRFVIMKLGKRITAILLLGLLVLGVTGCGSSEKREYIHFASTAENPPFAFVNAKGFFAQYDGIDMELVKVIATENHYMPAIENMEVSKYAAALQNDQAEAAIGAISLQDEKLQDAVFSHAYYDATQVVLGKAGTQIDDLKSKRICAVKGFFDEDALQTAGLTVTVVEKGDQALVNLFGGDCDVILADASLAKAYVRKNSELAVMETELSAEKQYGVAVKKGNTLLLDKINAVIDAMLADGRMDEVVLKYANPENS